MPVKGRRVTRQVLLDGAHDVLDRGVYRDLTVDRLARHLSMSKSTLYKYFLGKDAVVVALVDDVCEQTDADVEAVAGTGTAVEELEAMTRVFASYADRLPKGIILQPERLPRASKRRLKATTDGLTESIAACIGRGVQNGELSCSDAAVAATTLTSACFAIMATADGLRSEAVGQVMSLLKPGLGIA